VDSKIDLRVNFSHLSLDSGCCRVSFKTSLAMLLNNNTKAVMLHGTRDVKQNSHIRVHIRTRFPAFYDNFIPFSLSLSFSLRKSIFHLVGSK